MEFNVTFIEQLEKINVKLDLFPYHSHNGQYYTKSQVDSLISNAKGTLEDADDDLSDRIDSLDDDVASLSGSVSSLSSSIAGKLNTSQGVSNAGKILGVGVDGNVAPIDACAVVSSVTRWDCIRLNQTETPNVTLPVPDATKPQEILYIFTAMTTGASFTAPSGYILFDGDTAYNGLSNGNTVVYSDLTVGSIYECDFVVVGEGKISLLMIEHEGV